MTQERDWIDLLERREREAEAREGFALEDSRAGGSRAKRSTDLGASLASARRAAGYSHDQLAARMGCSATELRGLEESPLEGHSVAMLQRIAEALAMDLTVGFTRRSATPSSLELPMA